MERLLIDRCPVRQEEVWIIPDTDTTSGRKENGSHEKAVSRSDVIALRLTNFAISFERDSFVFNSEKSLESASPERVPEHLRRVL
jgi:hypothetical protein